MSRALDLKTLQDEIDGIVKRFSEKAKPIKGPDINNTDTTGFYQGDGKESKDLPTDGKYNLIVVANPDGSTSQLYIDLKTNKMHIRNKVDGKWQDWQPMLDGRDYAKLTTDINNILNKLVITSDINSNSTTDIASSKAVKTAYDKGVEALNAAQKAQNTANNATSKADQALNTLSSKQDKINISDSVSSTSHTDAASSYAVKLAYDKACSAQNSASSAQSTANSAESTASSAYNLASSVQSTASSAYNMASNAQSTASSAYSRANEAFQSASDGKSQIAGAINSKGGSASSSDSFYTLASEIRNIKTTSTTVSGATGNATCADVLSGRTFSNSTGNGLSGTMPWKGDLSVTPQSYQQNFSAGYYTGVYVSAADAPTPTPSGGGVGSLSEGESIRLTQTFKSDDTSYYYKDVTKRKVIEQDIGDFTAFVIKKRRYDDSPIELDVYGESGSSSSYAACNIYIGDKKIMSMRTHHSRYNLKSLTLVKGSNGYLCNYCGDDRERREIDIPEDPQSTTVLTSNTLTIEFEFSNLYKDMEASLEFDCDIQIYK